MANLRRKTWFNIYNKSFTNIYQRFCSKIQVIWLYRTNRKSFWKSTRKSIRICPKCYLKCLRGKESIPVHLLNALLCKLQYVLKKTDSLVDFTYANEKTWTCHLWCTITLPKVTTQTSFMEMLGNWNGLIKCYKQNGFTTTLVENMIPRSSDHLNHSCCSNVSSNGHYPLVGHRRVLKLDFILWSSWSLWITWLFIGAINEWSCKWGYVGQCKC